jgi:predicted outer membrane repeat protein
MKTILFVLITIIFFSAGALQADDTPKIQNLRTGIVYKDLQLAINDAQSSDTLKIDGTCVGSFTVAVTLTLTGGEHAVLDGNKAATVLDLTGNGLITVTLEHLTIKHGAAAHGAGINNIATLVLKHVKVIKNIASAGGGAISNSTSSNVSFGPGSVTVIESELSHNSSSGNGGAIETTGGSVTIFQSDVTKNAADKLGGGVYSKNSTVIITQSEVEFNRANDSGGGLYNDTLSTATLTQSEFEQNQANIGAGIFNNATLILNKSKVETNTATTNGGGLFNSATATSTFQFTWVVGNTAANGGGIFNAGGTLNFVKSHIKNNLPNNIAP